MKTQDEIIAEYEALQAKRQRNTLRRQGIGKANRKKLLEFQNDRCGLCKEILSGVQSYYDKKSGKIVCRCCMTYLNFWRKLRAKGVTEAMTIEFNE